MTIFETAVQKVRLLIFNYKRKGELQGKNKKKNFTMNVDKAGAGGDNFKILVMF